MACIPNLWFTNKNVEGMFPASQYCYSHLIKTSCALRWPHLPHAALDANPNCSIMDLWKSFTIADATVLDTLKSKRVNTCWKSLWSEVVNNFRNFPITETERSQEYLECWWRRLFWHDGGTHRRAQRNIYQQGSWLKSSTKDLEEEESSTWKIHSSFSTGISVKGYDPQVKSFND